MFAAILERADGFLQGRKIGEEGPGPFKNWQPALAVLAVMVWGVGCGRRRDEWLVTAGANWVLEWADGLPARGTEEGHRVGGEWVVAGEAFHR